MVLVSWASASWARRSLEVDRYDQQIQQSVRKYWGDFPHWQFWKAQLYQESLFDPEAVSPVGARGIAQFMPATWDQVIREIGLGNVSPHDSKYAILAGAYYMAKLRKGWSAKRSEVDRQRLALASYNAGMGNLLKAQRACGGANEYHRIEACLPQITGHFSQETITYVARIEDYTFRLLFRQEINWASRTSEVGERHSSEVPDPTRISPLLFRQTPVRSFVCDAGDASAGTSFAQRGSHIPFWKNDTFYVANLGHRMGERDSGPRLLGETC